MKRIATTLTASLIVLALAGVAWAGGPGCTSEAEAKAGDQCTYKNSQSAGGLACGVKADQAIYGFAVPTADCGHCVDKIQGALAEIKGVHCVHVDLTTSTAYIIADKKLNHRNVAKAIKAAGFSNKYQGSGKKVEAAFVKMMASGDDGATCCAKKNKDKV